MHNNTFRIALAGLGNVGANTLRILLRDQEMLAQRYGVRFLVTGVAEFGGGAVSSTGLDIERLLKTLNAGQTVASLPDVGKPGLESSEMLKLAEPDFLLEATPVNLEHGNPGLSVVREALQQGVHVIMANKGPMALAYDELIALSSSGDGWGRNYQPSTDGADKPALRFSACVAGALPTINVGERDFAGCHITRMEAVFNGTTQYILRAMEENQSYAEALADAQERGIAETDPTLDVDGWDSTAKLVIAANQVLGHSCSISDVAREGISQVSNEQVQHTLQNKQRLVLVCLAEWDADKQTYQLSVRPTPLPLDHPLAQMTPDDMGVVFYSEEVERMAVLSSEPGPDSASAAMIRDMLDIIRTIPY
ncbi:MAG: hypothetical protein ACPGVP_08720 [Thiolinea sp.]